MAPPVDPALLDEAVALARRAGELTLRWFRNADLVVDRKGDGTPVTEADRGAERLLREVLGERFPHDAISGEEEADTAGDSGRRWIIDPIDGTKAFTHGVPLYSNLVALHDEHGPALGVINLPALGETVYAGRGLGCFCDGAPARVSSRTSISDAYVMCSSVGASWPDDALHRVRHSGLKLRTWGDGYGYALVATGRAEAMLDYGIAPYDVAAMPVILCVAGGSFSDWAGAARIDSGTAIASNGALHEELLTLLTAGPRT
jgi:histidinol phosphatase-like enzyme (inositol monophosphatase family)